MVLPFSSCSNGKLWRTCSEVCLGSTICSDIQTVETCSVNCTSARMCRIHLVPPALLLGLENNSIKQNNFWELFYSRINNVRSGARIWSGIYRFLLGQELEQPHEESLKITFLISVNFWSWKNRAVLEKSFGNSLSLCLFLYSSSSTVCYCWKCFSSTSEFCCSCNISLRGGVTELVRLLAGLYLSHPCIYQNPSAMSFVCATHRFILLGLLLGGNDGFCPAAVLSLINCRCWALLSLAMCWNHYNLKVRKF